jgi:hypothetical protein
MRQAILVLAAVTVLAAPQWGQASEAFERARQDAAIEQQRAQAQVTELIAAANAAVTANKYAEAEYSLQNARRIVVSTPSLSAGQRATLQAELDRVAADVAARRGQYQETLQKTTAEQIAERERQRAAADKLFQERQTQSQWAQLRQFESRGNYNQALEQADALLRRQPNDQDALRAQRDLEFKSKMARAILTRETRAVETRQALVETDEAATPYNDLYRYPPARQWEEMSVRRLTRMAQNMDWNAATEVGIEHLEKRIDLNVDGVSLSNVLLYLSEAGGVPVITDPHFQADTNIDPNNQTVTINVKQLAVRQILDMVVVDPAGWRFSDGNVIVSGKDKANPLKTITYPIQHMTAEIPDFGKTVPRMNTNLTTPGEGSGNQNPFQPGAIDETPGTPPQDRIKDLIVRFVKGDHVAVWEENGGTATIEYFNGTFIISQTEAGHRKVAALLARL